MSQWPASNEPVLDSTIASILRDAAARAPDRVAVVAGAADPSLRRRRTYAEAEIEAEAVACALAARCSPGERIAVLAPSTPESCLLTFAAAMAGLVLVPLNPLLRAREIEHILARSGAAAAVFVPEYRDNDLAAVLAEIAPRLSELRELISFESWSSLVDAGCQGPLYPPRPDDVAQLVFTSGTTGAPKGVMLTHRGLTNAARLSGARFPIGEGDVYVSTIPLYHVGGQVVSFMVVQALATNVLVAQFDAGTHLELLEGERATHTVGVPTMLQDVISHPTFRGRDLSSLRALSCGGSMVPVELIRRLERNLGVKTTIIFGQTETCGYISQTFPGDDPGDKSTTVGRLLPHLAGRVVDPERGLVVSAGDVGELQVCGVGVMAGYFNEPEQTAAAIDPDGWLHTGDLVSMDERGYLRVAGRLKDMIVTGGVNVFPVEIEAVISEHPNVAQVAVVGVPDSRWGEAVVAVIALQPGADADVAPIEQFGRQRLAPYKVPKRWVVAESLPMTASGKVQKHLLRQALSPEAVEAPAELGGVR
jgi:fatty-acyl-CoA synthase